MENTQQPKKSSRTKVICIITLTLVGILLLSVALFYFIPVPQVVKEKHSGDMQRCLYAGGIGYYEAPTYDDGFYTLYDGQGELVCNSGGIAGKKVSGSCLNKMCFPIYDK